MSDPYGGGAQLRLFKDVWTEVQFLRKRLGELERDDSAMHALALRDGVPAPDTANAIGQIYVDEGGTVRIRYSNGSIYEFSMTLVSAPGSGELLDFSDEDMSMYLGLI